MLMAWNNQGVLYARLILHELKSNSLDFDRLCNDVSEIQRFTQSRNKGHGYHKEIHLSSVEGEGTFCRNA
jgi:hypothetical protein